MFDLKTKSELKKGNPIAYKDVFRILYPRLKGYCSLFISDPSQVDDIIQESFIKLWEKRELLKPDKSVENYLFVIVRNYCLSYLKKKRLETDSINLESLSNVDEIQFLYHLDFEEKDERSMEEMLIASFQEAVKELPEKMKLVFIKCKIEGLKQKAVAEELGISVKMVEKHIAKAKQQIRERLIDKYPLLITIIVLILK